MALYGLYWRIKVGIPSSQFRLLSRLFLSRVAELKLEGGVKILYCLIEGKLYRELRVLAGPASFRIPQL